MKENRFMKMRVVAVLPLLVLLSCATAGQNTDALSLDEAIEQSARKFQEKAASPKRIAIVQFDTEAEALSEYIMEEITGALVRLDFEVAERRNLDFVRNELDLQYSGEVDDEAMVNIGRFIGAESVLVGELLKVGNTYRYRLSSIGVENAVRETAVRLDVRNDRDFKAVIESLRSWKPAVPKLVSNPKTAGAFLDRGITLARQGEFEMAIADFTEAIKLNPNLSGAYLLRGRAVYASVSDVIDIGEKFERVGVHFKGGWKASDEQLRAYELAITDFTQAIKLASDNAVAYSDRGDTYCQIGDYDKAIADYNQAIRINPQYAWAYNNRANAYHYKGDNDKAVADYTQAIRHDPQFSYPYYNRGNQYSDKEDYDRAIADYTQAIRLDPGDVNAYINRGLVYDYKEDYDRAIADYNQAIRLNPNDADIYNNRGDAYYYKEDYDRAIADYTQAIKLAPNDALGYYNRGYAYDDKEDYDRAIADFTQAIRLDPDDADTYYWRGVAYDNKGDYNRARADWRKALELDPNNKNARESLGLQ
jgi:tetratricopeptide (TPR) repeat protein